MVVDGKYKGMKVQQPRMVERKSASEPIVHECKLKESNETIFVESSNLTVLSKIKNNHLHLKGAKELMTEKEWKKLENTIGITTPRRKRKCCQNCNRDPSLDSRCWYYDDPSGHCRKQDTVVSCAGMNKYLQQVFYNKLF